jgi:hypothetical protein
LQEKLAAFYGDLDRDGGGCLPLGSGLPAGRDGVDDQFVKDQFGVVLEVG